MGKWVRWMVTAVVRGTADEPGDMGVWGGGSSWNAEGGKWGRTSARSKGSWEVYQCQR